MQLGELGVEIAAQTSQFFPIAQFLGTHRLIKAFSIGFIDKAVAIAWLKVWSNRGGAFVDFAVIIIGRVAIISLDAHLHIFLLAALRLAALSIFLLLAAFFLLILILARIRRGLVGTVGLFAILIGWVRLCPQFIAEIEVADKVAGDFSKGLLV